MPSWRPSEEGGRVVGCLGFADAPSGLVDCRDLMCVSRLLRVSGVISSGGGARARSRRSSCREAYVRERCEGARACTARGPGTTGREVGVLHEGPGPVQYGRPQASTTPPSCSGWPERSPGQKRRADRTPPGAVERPGLSKSVTKARTVLIQADRSRMIPRFSFMRSGGCGFLCCRFGHYRADSPEESGATDPRERCDQRPEAIVTTRSARIPTWEQGLACSSSRPKVVRSRLAYLAMVELSTSRPHQAVSQEP